ncbi:MAG: amidohydrolase [Rhodospirillaceae bacterium]|nr:amidohydrolase [Rhodospirillaceae bacterium]
MPADNNDWLNQVPEDALEPERPICDPHHHLFIRRPNTEAEYYVPKFAADIKASGHNIVSSVYIECNAMYRADGPEAMKPVGEVEFANGQAAMAASGFYGPTKICAGIMGYADLRLGKAAGDVLDAQIAAGGGSKGGDGRFKGIRFSATWSAYDDIRTAPCGPTEHQFGEADFREGFAELAARNLVFEAWCYHTHILEVADLARAFPDTKMVLNHHGGPIGIGAYTGKQDEIFEVWRGDMAELAKCENVYAKLGGIQMEVNGYGWHEREKPPTSEELTAATRRWHDHAIEVFGTERCMFESNFPVDKMSCSYGVLWNSFKRIAADYSESEKTALFHDTAVGVYGV